MKKGQPLCNDLSQCVRFLEASLCNSNLSSHMLSVLSLLYILHPTFPIYLTNTSLLLPPILLSPYPSPQALPWLELAALHNEEAERKERVKRLQQQKAAKDGIGFGPSLHTVVKPYVSAYGKSGSVAGELSCLVTALWLLSDI